jgi:hypothetical protein
VLIAVTTGVQGLFGFVAWPGLSPNPFGAANYRAPLLAVLAGTPLLYHCPYVHWRRDRRERQQVEQRGQREPREPQTSDAGARSGVAAVIGAAAGAGGCDPGQVESL